MDNNEHGTNLAEVGTDCISREQAIETFKDCAVNGVGIDGIVDALKQLPPIQPKPLQPWEVLVAQAVLPQPEIVRCEDCKYWHSGSCEYPEHVVNSQDYYVGDIETEAEHFCGYAERREVTT